MKNNCCEENENVNFSPHIYENTKYWHNVDVVISCCKKCGEYTFGWIKTPYSWCEEEDESKNKIEF